LNDDHRTEVMLDGVRIDRITPAQVHGHFATVTLGPLGTNLDFSGTDIKVAQAKGAQSGAATTDPAFSCEGQFVPMQ